MERRRLGSLSLGWRVISRQLGSEISVAASVFLVILVGALVLASAPRLLERVSDDDLHATVSDPAPPQRNIRVERGGRLGAGPVDDPFRSVKTAGDAFAESEFPPSVAAVTSGHYYVVDSPRFRVSPLPGEEAPHPFPTYLRYRSQEGIEDRMTIVEGSLPSAQEPVEVLVGTGCPQDAAEVERLTEILSTQGETDETAQIDCRLIAVPHYQVAVTAATAEAMGLEPGTLMVLAPDPTDQFFSGIARDELEYRFVMSISGIIELTDPDDEYWYADPGLHQAAIRENADLRVIYATGLMRPEDYGPMLAMTGEAGRAYQWRHFVDPDLVVGSDVDLLLAELTPFELEYSPAGAQPTDYRVITQLADLLAAHDEQRSQTIALMSLSVAGLFAVMIGVVAVLAVLTTRRQRASVTLVRGRGSSRGQMVLTRLYQALLMVVPAAVLGYFLAGLLLPGTASIVPYRTTVALIVTAVAALVVAGLGLVLPPLARLQSTRPDAGASSARRLVVEIFIVSLAVGSTVVLRRRGSQDDVDPGGFDLLLALAPTLIAIAVGLVWLRLYPLLIRFLAWLGSRLRGLVGFVGFKRIQRMDFGANFPLLVIVLCVATATYASTLQTSIAAGQIATSWQEVGADFAVKGFGPDVTLPNTIDFDALGPYDAIAFAETFAGARVVKATGRSATDAMAIDADAYRELTKGTPGDVGLPEFMFVAPDAEIGTEQRPIPVIVSGAWPGDFDIAVGEELILEVGTSRLVAVASETRDRFPDIPPGRPFVVMSLDGLAATGITVAPTVAYLRAPPGAADQLASGLTAQSSSVRLLSRYETLERVSSDPFVRWSGLGFSLVFAFSAIFAAGAAISSLSITSATRRRDLGYLRTTGLDEGQAIGVTLIEQLPPAITGTIIGVGAGALAGLVLDQTLDLAAFTGGLVPTTVVLDWADLARLALALVGGLTVAVIMFVMVSRRHELSSIMRVGDEP